MCGPIDVVKRLTDRYVIIEPGDIKKIDIAHKLAKAFGESVDKLDRVLPIGGAIIVKTIGLELR